MPRYSITARVVASRYLGEVDADTPEEAVEKAYRELDTYIPLCWECRGELEDPVIDSLNVEVMEK